MSFTQVVLFFRKEDKCSKTYMNVHKRIVRFQKFLKNVVLIVQEHNIHCQQRELNTR
jgi:hypothetical protein